MIRTTELVSISCSTPPVGLAADPAEGPDRAIAWDPDSDSDSDSESLASVACSIASALYLSGDAEAGAAVSS